MTVQGGNLTGGQILSITVGYVTLSLTICDPLPLASLPHQLPVPVSLDIRGSRDLQTLTGDHPYAQPQQRKTMDQPQGPCTTLRGTGA